MKKIILAVVFSGCLGTAALAQPSEDPMAIENRVEKLGKEVEALRKEIQRIKRTPAVLAPDQSGVFLDGFDMRLQDLEEKFQKLTGQLEVMEHKIDTADKSAKKVRDDNELRFQMIEKKWIDAEEKEKKAAEAKKEKASAKAEKPKTEKTDKEKKKPEEKAAAKKPESQAKPPEKVSVPVTVPPASAAPAAVREPEKPKDEPKKQTEKEKYDAAFALVRANRYNEAIKAMQEIINEYPSGQYAGNAYYWMGECYYVQGKYDYAALAFGDGFQKHRKSAKAEDSLYKLGITFGKLGKMEEACTAFYSFDYEFPGAGQEVKNKVEQGLKDHKCQ